MSSSYRGFVLLEVLVSTVIIAIMAAGIGFVVYSEKSFTAEIVHRVEGINYARSVAELLLDQAYYNPGNFSAPLSAGYHDVVTDPDICTIPDLPFKNKFGGKVSYTISDVTVNSVPMLKVVIRSEWNGQGLHGAQSQEYLTFGLWKPLP